MSKADELLTLWQGQVHEARKLNAERNKLVGKVNELENELALWKETCETREAMFRKQIEELHSDNESLRQAIRGAHEGNDRMMLKYDVIIGQQRMTIAELRAQLAVERRISAGRSMETDGE
jgi:hypothetical protein